MTDVLATAALPLLRCLDPERAHGLALRALRLGLGGGDRRPDPASLAVSALGLDFRNPIGLAAGFDKNAVALAPLMKLGFGLVEAGTVTLRPQSGNPRPRLFRLDEDRAAINRLGFNNQGIAPYLARIRAMPRGAVPLGANLGINKDSTTPEADYAALVAAVADRADYVVVNISSPNTPGLVGFQAQEKLAAILVAIAAAVPWRPPLLVKVSPDLAEDGLDAVVQTAIAQGVDGLIICNTTTLRDPTLRSPHAAQAGGLSGAPLFAASTAMLRRAARLAAGRLLLVGSGGIRTGADILTKIRAGATLVQLYTEFAFVGPALIPRLKRELLAAMTEQGFARISDAIGADLTNQGGR
jgi:dihydroorotate dehydrogenase